MAGALNAVAGNDAPVPSMTYANGSGSVPLGGGALSYMPGVDPTLLSLMQAPPGPESPYARKLSDTSDALLGDPGKISGALSSLQTNKDQAIQEKMRAIQRAYDKISGLTQDQSNLPALSAAAAGLQPTWTGSIGERLGNMFSAASSQIEKQRQVQQQLAETLGNLDISGADTGIAGAQSNEGFFDKRLDLADKFANQAGQVQGRADLVNQRNRQGILQYAGRIGAADISANKNRYQYVGNDPNDPSVGQYLDKSTGQTVAGPGVTRPAAASATEYKYNIWLQNHPGDTAGALDFASGHRTMPPEQMRAAALRQAQQELGTGADPKDVDSRAQEIYGEIGGGFGGATPPPAAAPAPKAAPLAHKMTQDDINQSLANARSAIQKNPLAKPTIIQRLKAAGIDPSGL